MVTKNIFLMGAVFAMSCSSWTNGFTLLGELNYSENYSKNEQAWDQFDAYILDSPEEVRIFRYKYDDLFLIEYRFSSLRKIIILHDKKIFHVMGQELKPIEGGDVYLRERRFVKFSEKTLGRTTHSAKRKTIVFIPPS